MMNPALKILAVVALCFVALASEAARKDNRKDSRRARGGRGDRSEERSKKKRPSEPVPVAEGFADWKGFDTLLEGSAREYCPSDLRLRYTVVAQIKGNSNGDLKKQIKTLLSLQGLAFNPDGHTEWDFGVARRDCAVVFVIHEAKPDTYSKLKESDDLKKDIGAKSIVVYSDLTYEGAPDPQGEYPYVYVTSPLGKETIFQGKAGSDIRKKVDAAIKKARAEAKPWRDYYGYVEEVKHNKIFDAAVASGRTLVPAEKALIKNITSKDPEVAKESQMLYDAIMQKKSDLMFAIPKELKSNAWMAILYDFEELSKRWPAEKAEFNTYQSKALGQPDVSQLMKCYPTFRKCTAPGFTPESSSEASKLASEIKKAKPLLEKLSNASKTITVQNVAARMLTMIDDLPAELEAKVAK